jgi:uncharacterized membrane protein
MKDFIFAQLIKGDKLPHVGGPAGPGSDTLKTIFNLAFILIGSVATLMFVIAGFRYVRSGSNETITAEARRQMVHALVGLIVAASATLIINFVLKKAS